MDSTEFNEIKLSALEDVIRYWDGQYQDPDGALQVHLQSMNGLSPGENQIIKKNESILREFFEYVNGGPNPEFPIIQIPNEGSTAQYKVRIVQNRVLLTEAIGELRAEVWKTKTISQMTGLEFKSLLLDILQQAKASEKAK